ncbi:MAG: LytTR family DNA-binding domain-containing protein [Bacteroidetes bacterium]|nr:LytTR family DNA-binding domain-containing protein [Bacteroidota bacterium]
MKTIKTLIIDDEKLARNRILHLLASIPEFEIIGECKNGIEAVECINGLNPDLIFLDVQMPELDGFSVLRKLKANICPIIIFVTAYDKYALKAFDVHAVDYLLKPFDDSRFLTALEHAKEHLAKNSRIDLQNKINLLMNELGESLPGSDEKEYLDRIMIKSAGKISFVKTDHIIRIKSAGKYVSILTQEGENLIRQTMNEIEAKLDPKKFIRIHRTAIINFDFIKEMQNWYRGEYVILLTNNEKFTTSSSYRKNIEELISILA